MIKQIRANYNAKDIERDVQAYWDETDAYHRTKEHRAEGERFYFVDGPPYTTGAIHLGTAMNKTVKDILIRYWRMCGYNVRDQPGFDMHGLPIEVKVEKNIGVHSKKDIEEQGIDKFVNTCKEFALGLHADMTEQFKQLGGLPGVRVVDHPEGRGEGTPQGLQQGRHLVPQMRDRAGGGGDRVLGRDRPLDHGQVPPQGRHRRAPRTSSSWSPRRSTSCRRADTRASRSWRG